MIADIKTKDVMKKELIVLHPKDSIQEAEQIFNRYHIHHIPVVVDNKLVGIISLGDMLISNKFLNIHRDKFPANDQVFFNTVDQIMTPKPYRVNEEDSITKVLELMQTKRINCIPVVNAEGLTGIVTSFDIINFLNQNIETPCD